MVASLQEYRLEDCMDAIIDYRGKTPKKTDFGIPLITAKIIKSGRVQPITEYIAEDDYDSWMRRGIPQSGDIVLTTEAPLGEVAQLDDRKIALAQRVITLRGKQGLLNNDYLKYLLLSRDVQHQLDGRGTGTTVKGIKQSELREIILKFPDYQAQKNIAHILKTLDDKIELNRQTNQTLEKMAQALFKSWFVDFNPVIDNALAAGTNISDFPEPLQKRAKLRKTVQQSAEAKKLPEGLPQEIRKLFPSEFEESELGWVPKGWDTVSVSKAVQVNPRTTLPKGTVAKFADMKAVPTSGYMIDEIVEKGYKGGAKFIASDVLLARITPCLQNGKTALVDFLSEKEVGFGSTEFIVLRQSGNVNYPFIACLAREENFRNHCIQSMVGSSGRQRVQNACFDDYYLALPDNESILENFRELTSPKFNKMSLNKTEISNLSKLRDVLLPKLMSGELDISNN